MNCRSDTASTTQRPGNRLRRALAIESGSSTTELAIMAPILVAILLWLVYFWEMQQARIKAAEAARFLAFEGAVQRNPGTVEREVKDRWKDLDGSNAGQAQGRAYWNRLTIQKATLTSVAAPLSSASLSGSGQRAGIGGLLGEATKLLGNAVEPVVRRLGFEPNRGASRGEVEFKMENRIIPRKIAEYMATSNTGKLDLVFKERFELYTDTWRAWNVGNVPSASAGDSTVWSNTHSHTKNLAYLGLSTPGGIGSIVEGILNLDWPFDDGYKRDMVKIGGPGVPGNYPAGGAQTWLMPGQQVTACYWTGNDSCNRSAMGQVRTSMNWHMRAYNCRGKFFQGTTQSGTTEWEYVKDRNVGGRFFNRGRNACEYR